MSDRRPAAIHPCRGRSRVAVETFEAIAVGQTTPFRPKTIKALLDAGLIEQVGEKVWRAHAGGLLRVPVYKVPLPVHMQWCEWCDENVGDEE